MNSSLLSSSSNAAPQTGGVRFAPSPTGSFHVGNFRTAWISWLFSRSLGLPWVVRFEDIDRPRVLSGAQEMQASDMRELGMKADVTLLQSSFYDRHLEVFKRAQAEGAVYACDCSRKDVQAALAGLASAPNDGRAPIYSGHCRHRSDSSVGTSRDLISLAWRIRMPREDGRDDVIIARTSAEGEHFVPAYHWACAIDDLDGRYDLLVRSVDLAPALPFQRGIQEWMLRSDSQLSIESQTSAPARSLPRVFHTALVTQDDGQRLEKRTLGVTLSELHARGIGNDQLLKIFEKSFDRGFLTRDFGAGGILAESATELSLHQLGL